jgi:hypothetical protein
MSPAEPVPIVKFGSDESEGCGPLTSTARTSTRRVCYGLLSVRWSGDMIKREVERFCSIVEALMRIWRTVTDRGSFSSWQMQAWCDRASLWQYWVTIWIFSKTQQSIGLQGQCTHLLELQRSSHLCSKDGARPRFLLSITDWINQWMKTTQLFGRYVVVERHLSNAVQN